MTDPSGRPFEIRLSFESGFSSGVRPSPVLSRGRVFSCAFSFPRSSGPGRFRPLRPPPTTPGRVKWAKAAAAFVCEPAPPTDRDGSDGCCQTTPSNIRGSRHPKQQRCRGAKRKRRESPRWKWGGAASRAKGQLRAYSARAILVYFFRGGLSTAEVLAALLSSVAWVVNRASSDSSPPLSIQRKSALRMNVITGLRI